MKILVLCDDKWHPVEIIEKGIRLLENKDYQFDLVMDAKDILTPELLNSYQVVMNCKGNAITGANAAPWFEETVTEVTPKEFRQYVEQGGGFLSVHAGNTFSAMDGTGYSDLVGNSFVTHPPRCLVTVHVSAKHPITEGVQDFTERDEHYNIDHLAEDIQPFLSTTSQTGGTQMGGYARTLGKGRICVLTPGHTLSVWENENYQKLIHNAIDWCCGK